MQDAHNTARIRILNEALRLFAHNGYGSTSIREIAEAAGITKPTLYYHFGSKEGLFHALVELHLTGLQQLVEATVSGAGSASERLRTFVEHYLLGALSDLDATRFMFTCSLPNAPEQPRCDVVQRHLQHIEPLTDVIRQGIASGELDPDLDAHAAVVALVGTLNLHLVAAIEGAVVDESTVDALLRIWLHGVRAR